MNIILACLICALKSASVFADLYSEADEVNGNALGEQQQHMLNGDCPFTADHGSIIKTNESLTNNAVFIEFHKGKSREECLRGCCELENCNLAVYEKKEEHNCYLFNCGREAISRCHFSHHEDYMTMTLTPTRSRAQPSKAPQTVQDQHEDELEGLADKKQELPSSPKVVKSTPVPSRSTTTTTSSPQNNQNAEAYGVVYGECAEGRYCSDNNAECIEGICICKHGFHYRHGACISLEDLHSPVGPVPASSEGRDGRPPITIHQGNKDHAHLRPDEKLNEKPQIPNETKAAIEKGSENEYGYDHRGGIEEGAIKTDSASRLKDLSKSDIGDSGPALEVPVAKKVSIQEKVDGAGRSDADNDTPKIYGNDKADEQPEKMESHLENLAKPKLKDVQRPVPKLTQTAEAKNIQSKQMQVDGGSSKWKDHQDQEKDKYGVQQQPHPQNPLRSPSFVNNYGAPGRNIGRQRIYPQQQQQHHGPPIQVGNSGRPLGNPVNPPRSRYPYPYSPDGDRAPIPQYPIQYPSYDWDYHPEEYGAAFPERDEDYSNTRPLDQGVYDYPGYRHNYFGPGPETAPSGNHNKPKSSSQGRKPHKSHVSDPSSVNVGPAIDRRPVSTTRSTTVATTTITATTSAAQKMVTTTQSAPTPTHSATEIASSPSKANDTEEHAEKSPSMKKNGEGVAVEQIIIASPTDSAQGPIVALALGLAFTIMLLFFVGCRLRTVKRRIRKGRPLHSNEADYLINGMYL